MGQAHTRRTHTGHCTRSGVCVLRERRHHRQKCNRRRLKVWHAVDAVAVAVAKDEALAARVVAAQGAYVLNMPTSGREYDIVQCLQSTA